MPNDAKLGLMIGVAVVLILAIVFFRRDMATPNPAVDAPAVGAPADATPAPETDAGNPPSGEGLPLPPSY